MCYLFFKRPGAKEKECLAFTATCYYLQQLMQKKKGVSPEQEFSVTTEKGKGQGHTQEWESHAEPPCRGAVLSLRACQMGD